MTFTEEFGDWLAYATVGVEPFTGPGAWGETTGAVQSIPAWYDYQERRATLSDGSTVTTNTALFADASYLSLLAPGGLITIPGHPEKLKIITCRSWPGDDTHLEVTLL